jgi:hypothetical protein
MTHEREIAEKLKVLTSLPPGDTELHGRLLNEVNNDFQSKINEKRREQAQAHAAHQPYDLRGEVINVFRTVENYVHQGNPNEIRPIHSDYIDISNNGAIDINALPQATSREQPQIPTCFQISDANSKLSFTINTNGAYNPDFLYQKCEDAYRRKLYNKNVFPSNYDTWSQHWGGSKSKAQPYQPNLQPKGRFEL